MLAGLLDDHIAGAFTASQEVVAGGQRTALVTAASYRGIMQGLISHWPALPALLLQGAVQRLTHSQCTTQRAEVIAGWMAMLLATSALPGQQASKEKARGNKRKSMTMDQAASTHVQHPGSFPSAAQTKQCIQILLQGLSGARPGVDAVVQQVLSLLLEELRVNHVTDYLNWGGRAQQLGVLAQPDQPATAAVDVDQQRQQGYQQQQGVAEAIQEQQKLLQFMQAKVASATTAE